MPKKANLAEAFKVDANELQPKPELEIVDPEPTDPKPAPKVSEPKKKHIGGYFNLNVYTQLKVLGAEKGHDDTRDISSRSQRCLPHAR